MVESLRTPDKMETSPMVPQRELYRIAIARIQSSGTMRVMEIVLWSITALYLGLLTSHLTPYVVGSWAFRIAYWTIFATTPFLIGGWVHRTHFVPGDETLKITPVRASEVINPRVKAVAVTWLRFAAPLIVLLVVSHEATHSYNFPNRYDRVLRTAAASLLAFPCNGPQQLECEAMWQKDDEGNFVRPRLLTLNDAQKAAVIGLGVLHPIGWLNFPIMWGFYLRTRLRQGGGYWVWYFAHLLPVAGLAYINYLRVLLPPVGRVWPFYAVTLSSTATYTIRTLHHGWTDWLWMLLYGLGGVLLSLFLYVLALRSWARRKS